MRHQDAKWQDTVLTVGRSTGILLEPWSRPCLASSAAFCFPQFPVRYYLQQYVSGWSPAKNSNKYIGTSWHHPPACQLAALLLFSSSRSQLKTTRALAFPMILRRYLDARNHSSWSSLMMIPGMHCTYIVPRYREELLCRGRRTGLTMPGQQGLV